MTLFPEEELEATGRETHIVPCPKIPPEGHFEVEKSRKRWKNPRKRWGNPATQADIFRKTARKRGNVCAIQKKTLPLRHKAALRWAKSNLLNKQIMFLEVTQAEYLDGYRLRLHFNNGEVRDVDLRASLRGEVFAPLKDIEYFKNFTIKFNTVEWANGADFAPEYLYDLGKAS